MNDVAIQVEGLNHAFGKGTLRKQILFDITTEIPVGDVVIVTGPSGSGKTTFLTLVSALRSVQRGRVNVLGMELSGATRRVMEKARRKIGFIFQQHNLLHALSAVQNVELGLRVHRGLSGREMRRKAEAILGEVGLTERLHYKPDQLSGGQRQRVAIARALASGPPMLVADEPTASLDKDSGREVVDRMRSMAKDQGATILLVTHDNRILDIADRIVYLEDGRLQTFTDAVIENSQHMMRILAQQQSAEAAEDAFAFRAMLEEFSVQTERLLAVTTRANKFAFKSILEQGVQALLAKLRATLGVDGVVLYRADEGALRTWMHAADSAIADHVVPIGRGSAGHAALSGGAIRRTISGSEEILDASEQIEGLETVSVVSVPVHTDAKDQLVGVLQIRNGPDRQVFEPDAEKRMTEVGATLRPVLESLYELG